MFSKSLIVIFLAVSAVSCNTGSTTVDLTKSDSSILGKDSLKPINPAAAISCSSVEIDTAVYSTTNNEFVLNVLKSDLTCESLNKVFSGIKKHIVLSTNKYSSATSDTTVTYKVDCDSVAYLASKANCFPLHISAQSGRIKLINGSIKIGMSKQQFLNELKLKDVVSNVIKITETEGANELIFVFINQSLFRIVYNNLYVE
jgi:hypothetical protein